MLGLVQAKREMSAAEIAVEAGLAHRTLLNRLREFKTRRSKAVLDELTQEHKDNRCWYLKEENRHDKDLQVAVGTRIKGGIMLWGAITACGLVALIRVDGRIGSGACEVLFERLLPYLEKHGRDLVFQQDKCPVHTSRRMGVDMAV
ncbi:hypothetical protein RvY_07539 [Ramazzottius varieornatus]|uniref:Tc1-like transposase DDE domain-containing protein n=1 Tax=Ramazzottius varieornatus TaxID=947166 RepID=A0A1D1V2J6_RAMVA|nr:hypothetical protein RvY_07539 [Ramazzottius varieornatus]